MNNASALERADDLLARMTLIEKAQQVSAVMPNVLLGADGGTSRSALDTHLGNGIGHISANFLGVDKPVKMASLTNSIQRYLVENTRLGIPAMIHAEALNGFMAPGFTSFPTAIGLAATWDPSGVHQMADIIREQMCAVGIRHALSPVLDLARDARWGRVHETYGEDVYLASAFGVAFVRGLQGQDLSRGVLATAKHFLGYSLTEAGQNMAATHLGSRELYDVWATPFEAAIKLADLASVMNSYSEIDGVPVGASYDILTRLLRDRMGFEGSVVSDYMTVEWLHNRQHVTESFGDAGALALSAGLDIELPSPAGYGHHLVQAVQEGRLTEDILNNAVRRALVDKFKAGLFDHPYVDEDPIVIDETAGRGRDLSRRLANESITLLKNNGVLPLAENKKRVAVLGPHAESAMVNFAAYTYPAQLDMMRGLASGESRMAGVGGLTETDPEAADAAAAAFAELMKIDTENVARHGYGTKTLVEAMREALPDAVVVSETGVGIHPDDPQNLAAAVEAAAGADVAILAIGGKAGWFGTRITEGEGTDVAHVELPAHQVQLVKAVAETGTPVVAVLYQGRPYAVTEIEDQVQALLVAYYPGPEGGRAVASTLVGETNPSGKLPYTMPRATGQLPLYYSQKHGSGIRRGDADMFRSYIDLANTPLYPFGHGLSYTSFDYANARVDSEAVPTDGGFFTMEVDVTNTGTSHGVETVQFYISDTAYGVTRPALQLVGFARAELEPGQQATVACTVDSAQLGYSGLDGRFVIEPGPLTMFAGSSSSDLRQSRTIKLVGDIIDLEGKRAYLSETKVSAMAQDAQISLVNAIAGS